MVLSRVFRGRYLLPQRLSPALPFPQKILASLGVFLLMLMLVLVIGGCRATSSVAVSEYAIAQRSAFNQPGYFPLEQVQVVQHGGGAVLQINAEPVQIAGRFVALAKIEQAVNPPHAPRAIAMVPRVAHDELARLLMNHGATLWVLRTNQVGGWDANIQPLAATQLLERYFVIPNSFSRLIESLRFPSGVDWGVAIAALLFYGLIAIPLGFRYHLLQWSPAVLQKLSGWQRLGFGLKHLFLPALLEELVFRVLLIPHPSEGVTAAVWLGWAIASLMLFVVYHPINALTVYKAGNPTFLRPIFWGLVALLGGVCTVVYGWTGSLWAIALIHWVVVMVWLLVLGGLANLSQHNPVAR